MNNMNMTAITSPSKAEQAAEDLLAEAFACDTFAAWNKAEAEYCKLGIEKMVQYCYERKMAKLPKKEG